MQTTIQLTPSYKTADSIILLLDDKGSVPSGLFSTTESEFIKNELKADKKSIVINQYKRLICIYQPDYSKDTDSLLELCRRIGDNNTYKTYPTLFFQRLFNLKQNQYPYWAFLPSTPPAGKAVNRTVFQKDNIKLKIYYTRSTLTENP